VSSNMHAGSPCYAAAELTWGVDHRGHAPDPTADAALRTGTWQIGVGNSLRGKTLGSTGTEGSVLRSRLWKSVRHATSWCGGARPSLERARRDGYAVARNKREFFASAEVISLHMRLVKETRGS